LSFTVPTQQAIRQWFNRTYTTKGLSYLRPPEFYSIFMEYLQVGQSTRLLDIGCGPGLLLAQALDRGASAWGIDLSDAALAMAEREAPGAHELMSFCAAPRNSAIPTASSIA
jgi:predicted TPR repeat methyltransferase